MRDDGYAQCSTHLHPHHQHPFLTECAIHHLIERGALFDLSLTVWGCCWFGERGGVEGALPSNSSVNAGFGGGIDMVNRVKRSRWVVQLLFVGPNVNEFGRTIVNCPAEQIQTNALPSLPSS
jgi:hypothetical protein